jgi:cation transport protein ChaC
VRPPLVHESERAVSAGDPFLHLPELRGKLRPAQESEFRGTWERLAHWDARARALGHPADWRQSDQQLEDGRRALLGPALGSGRDIWVFGYGSLMWDPGFHFVEVRLAELAGHQRRFSYWTRIARGTRERPALMLTLEPRAQAAACIGLAFRIAGDAAEVETGMLWRREMVRNGYCPRLLPVTTPQGGQTALVFTCNPAHADYAGERGLDETAAIIAAAAGASGSNREYLELLAHRLAELGITDDYVLQLCRRVQELAAG